MNLTEELVKILSNHCGETGENEGAVETLNRIIGDAEKWNNLENAKTHEALVDYQRLVKLEEGLKKLLGNTSKNPEHCCQAFEYIRDTLQKIVREKND